MDTTTRLGFRQRPIHPDFATNTQISRSLRIGRSYQRQHIGLSDAFNNTAAVPVGGFSGYSMVALMPGDLIVSAVVSVAILSAVTTYDVEVNGSLVGASLGGTWTTSPNSINIAPFAVPLQSESPPSSRLIVRLKNVSGNTAAFGFQLSVTVLR